MEKEAIANTPDWVKREVREKMADWKRRCDIDLAKEAEDRLAQKLTEIVDFIIQLALKKPDVFQVTANGEQEEEFAASDRGAPSRVRI